MKPVVALNVGLRGVLEAGIVGAFAYWGAQVATDTPTRVLLGIGAPAVAFGTWGFVDFHQLARGAEAARLLEELAISGLAAAALWAAGKPAVGLALGTASLVHHAIVYATGERLLEPATADPG